MDVIALAKINALKKSGSVGYKEPQWVGVLPETTVEVTYVEALGLGVGECVMEGSVSGGDTVKVMFDGTLYECVVTDAFQIGNISLLAGDSAENTGEPFMLYYDAGDEGARLSVLCVEGSHNISLDKCEIVTHKINQEFIPSIPCITLETEFDWSSGGEEHIQLSESDSRKMFELDKLRTSCVIQFAYTINKAPRQVSLLFNYYFDSHGTFYCAMRTAPSALSFFHIYQKGDGWNATLSVS